MSGSSAYSNVLLTSPAQTQATAPKRDYQDDFSNANFSQTFREVRDTERQREEAIKPASKKAAPVHGRDKSTEVRESRESKASRAPGEKDSVKSADKQDTKCVVDKNKPSDDASIDDKNSKKDDDSTDSSAQASANLLQPDTTKTATSSELNLGLSVISTDKTKGAESDATVNSDVSVDATQSAINVLASGETDPTASTLTTDTRKLTKDAASENTETSGDTANVQQSAAQTSTDASLDPTALAAQQSLAATTATAQAKTTDVSAEDSADVISSMVGDLASEKATKAAATDANSATKAEPEKQTTTLEATDSKSIFEKMLQSVARSSSASNTRDESAALTPANNSNSSGGSTGLDSLMRFGDSQAPASRGFVVQTAVAVPVGQPQWSQAVGEKVLWLAAQNISSAEISLHPKDLGPIQVKVSVNQEQTTVNFTSHHPVVREVLDQNLNRLRDMFSEQGLNLVNVDVSDKSFSRQQGDAKDQKGQGGANNAVSEEETVVAVSNIMQQRLVDHYA